jgi:hypothetical protein
MCKEVFKKIVSWSERALQAKSEWNLLYASEAVSIIIPFLFLRPVGRPVVKELETCLIIAGIASDSCL